MKSKSSTFILIIVVLLVVGGLVYFFVIKGKDGGAPASESLATGGLVSTNTGRTTGAAVATTGTANPGDQVVALLRNLSTIQLSDAVFVNPSFSQLRDISIVLPPVTNQGRRNPFAPIGGENVAPAPTGTVPAASAAPAAPTAVPATAPATATPGTF